MVKENKIKPYDLSQFDRHKPIGNKLISPYNLVDMHRLFKELKKGGN